MLNRRTMLKSTAAGLGAAVSSSFTGSVSSSMSGNLYAGEGNGAKAGPRRVIFFLQNQGFDPATCITKGLTESTSLDGVELPLPISPLEAHKDKLNIISGLHGRHTSPSHSAYFGALGGYRGGIGVPPSAATIDYAISEQLSPTILQHLRIGMDALENMKSRPTLATLSAAGPGKPLFMHSNPQDLYQLLFGGIATGDVRQKHAAKAKVFERIEQFARSQSVMPTSDPELYASYVDGLGEINSLREKLAGASEQLTKFAPAYDEKFTNPQFETDWHDALLDLGIAALQAGLTNVLTIGSGRGEIFGSWKGLDVVPAGHNLGHMNQFGNPIWDKIRQYNCRMLVKMIEALEAMPEGSGTMMDNTLIVYTSNNADKQHSGGEHWPVVLLGNCGGRIKTGQYTQLKSRRPINDLYTTLLHAIDAPQDRFNLDRATAEDQNSQVGPIEELMA